MKGKKIIKLFIELILITFIFSYVIEQSGYYEYNLQSRKNMTEKEIKKFESDIKEGKEIDIKNYLNETTTDYSNNLTKNTSAFSINLNRYLIKTIKSSMNIFSRLFK